MSLLALINFRFRRGCYFRFVFSFQTFNFLVSHFNSCSDDVTLKMTSDNFNFSPWRCWLSCTVYSHLFFFPDSVEIQILLLCFFQLVTDDLTGQFMSHRTDDSYLGIFPRKWLKNLLFCVDIFSKTFFFQIHVWTTPKSTSIRLKNWLKRR